MVTELFALQGAKKFMTYNKTQLDVGKDFERHIYHRDRFAHYFRWSHIMKCVGKLRGKCEVLDVGCGTAELLEVLYRNRMAPKWYCGVDVRESAVYDNEAKMKLWGCAGNCMVYDATRSLPIGHWDFITCLEMLEHVPRADVPKVLDNIRQVANQDTTVFISTPCYDASVGAAANHIGPNANGVNEVREWTYADLKALLLERFDLINHWGTFASQRDVEDALKLSPASGMYQRLKEYYDSNTLAVLFAPLYPSLARNCLWELRKKS